MTKPTKWSVRLAKTDQPGHSPGLISLRCPHEETFGPQLPIGCTAKTDQTGWMPRLIWVFAGYTDHFVGFCHKVAHMFLWKTVETYRIIIIKPHLIMFLWFLYSRRGLGLACMGGAIYAVGGLDDKNCFDTVERYDPNGNAWTQVASLNLPRGGVGVAVLKVRHLYDESWPESFETVSKPLLANMYIFLVNLTCCKF